MGLVRDCWNLVGALLLRVGLFMSCGKVSRLSASESSFVPICDSSLGSTMAMVG